jgi:hypothetical protein
MQRGNAKYPLARLQNASTAAEPTRQILPTVLHINKSASYINGNRASRNRQHLLLSSSKLAVQLSSRRHIQPRPHKTWAQAASQLLTPTDPHSLRSVLETVKSILAVLYIQKLCQTLRTLVLQLQTINVLLSEIMVFRDAVATCSSS